MKQHRDIAERSPERLEISSIAAGGEGVAHLLHEDHRRAVFVPQVAPGDILEAMVDWRRKPARARVVRMIEASSMRVIPPCTIAANCGGCDLMHLTLEAQVEVHRAIVAAALERAHDGRSEAGARVPHIATHPAPRAAGYRTRARLAVRTERGGVVLGYRQASSREVLAVERCWVLDDRLNALLPDLQDLFRDGRGHGEVAIALGTAGRPVIDLRWTGELEGSFFAALGARIEKGVYAGAEVWLDGARAPARFGDPRALTSAADGEPMWVPSGAFAQAHPAMNIELGERLLACTEPSGQAVVELFGGSGNFTVLLARHAGSLIAVESDARAVDAARANLARRGLTARILQRDADSFELPPGVRLVVLDPPRAGAGGAMRQILASRARRVVYVSCNVSTLARDIATLAGGGFQLSTVDMFEMFPHTSHVEALVVLDRRRPSTSARAT